MFNAYNTSDISVENGNKAIIDISDTTNALWPMKCNVKFYAHLSDIYKGLIYDEQTVIYGRTYDEPEDPEETQSGEIFIGWSVLPTDYIVDDTIVIGGWGTGYQASYLSSLDGKKTTVDPLNFPDAWKQYTTNPFWPKQNKIPAVALKRIPYTTQLGWNIPAVGTIGITLTTNTSIVSQYSANVINVVYVKDTYEETEELPYVPVYNITLANDPTKTATVMYKYGTYTTWTLTPPEVTKDNRTIEFDVKFSYDNYIDTVRHDTLKLAYEKFTVTAIYLDSSGSKTTTQKTVEKYQTLSIFRELFELSTTNYKKYDHCDNTTTGDKNIDLDTYIVTLDITIEAIYVQRLFDIKVYNYDVATKQKTSTLLTSYSEPYNTLLNIIGDIQKAGKLYPEGTSKPNRFGWTGVLEVLEDGTETFTTEYNKVLHDSTYRLNFMQFSNVIISYKTDTASETLKTIEYDREKYVNLILSYDALTGVIAANPLENYTFKNLTYPEKSELTTQSGDKIIGWTLTADPFYITALFNKNKVYYTVEFSTEYSIAPETLNVEEGLKATNPGSLTDTSHNFEGWYTSSSFLTLFDFDHTAIYDNTTIYAKWLLKYCTVSFSTEFGSKPADLTILKGSTATNPGSLTDTSHNFEGWYTTNTYETLFDFNSAIYDNTTIYAKWSLIENVTITYILDLEAGRIFTDYIKYVDSPYTFRCKKNTELAFRADSGAAGTSTGYDTDNRLLERMFINVVDDNGNKYNIPDTDQRDSCKDFSIGSANRTNMTFTMKTTDKFWGTVKHPCLNGTITGKGGYVNFSIYFKNFTGYESTYWGISTVKNGIPEYVFRVNYPNISEGRSADYYYVKYDYDTKKFLWHYPIYGGNFCSYTSDIIDLSATTDSGTPDKVVLKCEKGTTINAGSIIMTFTDKYYQTKPLYL